MKQRITKKQESGYTRKQKYFLVGLDISLLILILVFIAQWNKETTSQKTSWKNDDGEVISFKVQDDDLLYSTMRNIYRTKYILQAKLKNVASEKLKRSWPWPFVHYINEKFLPDVKEKDVDNRTVIHHAVDQENVKLIVALLGSEKVNAQDINQKDVFGHTPLDYTNKKNITQNMRVIQQLLHPITEGFDDEQIEDIKKNLSLFENDQQKVAYLRKMKHRDSKDYPIDYYAVKLRETQLLVFIYKNPAQKRIETSRESLADLLLAPRDNQAQLEAQLEGKDSIVPCINTLKAATTAIGDDLSQAFQDLNAALEKLSANPKDAEQVKKAEKAVKTIQEKLRSFKNALQEAKSKLLPYFGKWSKETVATEISELIEEKEAAEVVLEIIGNILKSPKSLKEDHKDVKKTLQSLENELKSDKRKAESYLERLENINSTLEKEKKELIKQIEENKKTYLEQKKSLKESAERLLELHTDVKKSRAYSARDRHTTLTYLRLLFAGKPTIDWGVYQQVKQNIHHPDKLKAIDYSYKQNPLTYLVIIGNVKKLKQYVNDPAFHEYIDWKDDFGGMPIDYLIAWYLFPDTAYAIQKIFQDHKAQYAKDQEKYLLVYKKQYKKDGKVVEDPKPKIRVTEDSGVANNEHISALNLDDRKGKTSTGKNIVHLSIHNKDMIKDLIEEGLCNRSNIMSLDNYGESPIHCLLRIENEEIKRAILDMLYDNRIIMASCSDRYGRSLLHHAMICENKTGDRFLLDWLIEKRSCNTWRLQQKDKYGKTPIDYTSMDVKEDLARQGFFLYDKKEMLSLNLTALVCYAGRSKTLFKEFLTNAKEALQTVKKAQNKENVQEATANT